MPFPIEVKYQVSELYGATQQTIMINGGLTTFVGPNGSGKTQVMRALKNQLGQQIKRKARYLSAGRLALLENFRCDYDGKRGQARYDSASYGGKDYRESRHNAETAYGDFHTLSIRPDLQIKVAERLRRLFNRDIYFEWDAGNLKVMFKRNDCGGNPYSSAREASGLLQLVVNLAALYDNEIGALLIDEPEVSLHPQLQAFLLREIQNVAGDPDNPQKKIVIIATHSTEMISINTPEDLAQIVFFKDALTPPNQISPDVDELKNKKLRSLLARLGQTQKTAFFSLRPLLVEGPSDAIICNALDRQFDLYLGTAGTQIVPIIGKGQMPIVAKLMRLIGKTPIVLADLDGYADDLSLINIFTNDEKANKAAQDKGHTSLSSFAGSVYSDFCQTVENHWNDIEHDAIKHSYWLNRDTDKYEIIAKRRSAMASLATSSEEHRISWNNTSIWEGLYRRLIALFDFLEFAGCFILRKGSIENYYQFANHNTSSEKPSAAVQEIEQLFQQEKGTIEQNYNDILRALTYSSKKPTIDEAAALADLLLATVAPILARVSKETPDTELDSIARQILGERSILFKITNVTTNDIDPTVQIDIDTSVLDITGFPLKLNKNGNLIRDVQTNIRQKHV